MLHVPSRSFVCWRCAVRNLGSKTRLSQSARTLVSSGIYYGTRTPSTISWRGYATVQHSLIDENASTADPAESKDDRPVPIRERLRAWKDENRSESESMLTDFAPLGELTNNFTRPQNVSMAQFEVTTPLFEGDELSDLRSNDTQLRPGDMVEMSSEGSRRPLLALCLGRFNGYEHYLTSSGKWFTGLGIKTLFVVTRFVEPSELEPIIAVLPTGDTPVEELNKLQDLGHGPSRSVAGPLLKKMLDFAQEAEVIYQANASTLDSSSALIGDPDRHLYLTLHEIADLVLSSSLKKDGKYTAPVLYAVHRALLQNEVFFRPLRQTGHRGSYLFEVSPLSEVRIVQRIENMVRTYLASPSSKRGKTSIYGASLMGFIEKGRAAIDQSRQVREFSRTGMIGPSTSRTPAHTQWAESDLDILKFIELWASYQKFPNYSRLQTLGAAILRELDRYQAADHLDATTGWTFLQEVGWIPPWEIPSRYSVRFPDVVIKRGGGFVRPPTDKLVKSVHQDIFLGRRETWNETTAYCIDSSSTMDVDDAVSIQRTSNPDNHWIHVHIADPASSISPGSSLAKLAELVPQTIYLPGHFDRMLPASISQERFSLAAGKPCLTFSALVNAQGSILDYKITPSTLDSVVYMTPEDVNSALGEQVSEDLITTSGEQLLIGTPGVPGVPFRTLTRPGDLSKEQNDDLTLLAQLGKAVQAQRLDKGATPYFQPRPEPKVRFDNVDQTDGPQGFISVAGDPSIHITFSHSSSTDLVGNCMRLAGEVAARWCNDRGIPIPYRIQPDALQNAALIQQYTRDVFYPLLKAGARPDENQWRHLRALTGGDNISTTPGPHFTLGVDMYTKATSPLRRFSDLVVHWQIEAALIEEMKRGKSLEGNKDDSFLPFSRERLDRMLPMLRVREKQAQTLSRGDGTDQWILQALVRAWRFKEATLPETFRFKVVHVASRRSIMGRLNWFDRVAFLKPEALNNVCRMAEVMIGDVFEVQLKAVNVHANLVQVEAVSLLERPKHDQTEEEKVPRVAEVEATA